MQWKAFKDELPEEGRLILFGNHRYIEVEKYKTEKNIWMIQFVLNLLHIGLK